MREVVPYSVELRLFEVEGREALGKATNYLRKVP
jgi:hypothetical protein